MHNRQKNIGVVAILVASLLWAVEAIFVKLAGEHSPIARSLFQGTYGDVFRDMNQRSLPAS